MCRVAVSGGLILWYPLAAHCRSTWEAAYNCIKIIYRPDWGYLYRVFMGYINCCIPIFNRCNPMQPPFHVRCGTPLAHARAPNSRVWPAHCRMCTLTTGMSQMSNLQSHTSHNPNFCHPPNSLRCLGKNWELRAQNVVKWPISGYDSAIIL